MDITIGDKVYHKSAPSIIWVVDRIEQNEAHCSTVVKETFEKKEAKFLVTSIEKFVQEKIGIYVSQGRKNHY